MLLNLSIPDAHFLLVQLPTLNRSWFQVKPANFLFPTDLFTFLLVEDVRSNYRHCKV